MSSIWTREELLELIADWKAAYKAVSTSKSYTLRDGRSLTRQDVAEIRSQLRYLEQELAKVSGLPAGPVFVAGRVPR